MKLLLDENLSHRIVRDIESIFPGDAKELDKRECNPPKQPQATVAVQKSDFWMFHVDRRLQGSQENGLIFFFISKSIPADTPHLIGRMFPRCCLHPVQFRPFIPPFSGWRRVPCSTVRNDRVLK
jgi:hypothetical protein